MEGAGGKGVNGRGWGGGEDCSVKWRLKGFERRREEESRLKRRRRRKWNEEREAFEIKKSCEKDA